MHRAWLIEDIEQSVLDYLDHADLARLARTCSLLFEFASNRLWRKLISIQQILSCFPEDTKNRELVSSDLERLYLYSSKVQIVHLEGTLDRPMTVPRPFQNLKKPTKKSWRVPWINFCEEIEAVRSRKDFFPYLRRIRINNVDEEVLLPFIGIGGANLEMFYVKYIQHSQPESVVRKILENLEDTTKLEYLYVRNGGLSAIPTRIVEQSPLTRLRFTTQMIHRGRYGRPRYENYIIRPEFFKKNTVKELSVALNQGWCPEDLNISTEKYFPSLETLWMDLVPFNFKSCRYCSYEPYNNALQHGWLCQNRGDSTTDQLGSPVAFFGCLDNPEIRKLAIKFDIETTTGSMFLEVIAALSENCRLHNLNQLSLIACGYVGHCDECYRYPKPMISRQDLSRGIKMLFPLPRLRKLNLDVISSQDTQTPGSLSNEEIGNLFHSIESLSVGGVKVPIPDQLGSNF